MHELSIANELMEQILEIAEKNSLVSIQEVELETGALKQVIPEIMQTAFKEVSYETIAEGAKLHLREKKALVKCRVCQNVFEPEIDCFVCGVCEQADFDIVEGNDILLMAIIGSKETLERKNIYENKCG